MTRIAIDPVTRIGGHLRVEAEVENGAVTDAWTSGTMFRGMESVLLGRDPRDAWLFAQRICGSCTSVHALASVRAVEQALGVRPPRNARLIRNLIAGTQYLLDHVVHFYLLHAPDWVDVAAALRADPAATARLARTTSSWPQSSPEQFRAVAERLAASVGGEQAGPFARGPWGHPAYRMPPEAGLLLMAHYLEALDWQRKVSRIHTILGGKNPHPQSFLVGGMVLAPPWGGPARGLPGEHPQQIDRRAPAALSDGGLADIGTLVGIARTFVEQVYVPDVLLLAGHYRDWAAIGTGIGSYLAYGEFPEDDGPEPRLLLPRGRIVGRAMGGVEPVDQAAVAESVARSHYADDGDEGALRQAFDGRTTPRYGGPKPPVTTLADAARYSWIKAPRYDDAPMEVGPLARVLVAYVEGRAEVRTAVEGVVTALDLGPEALFSTLGRILARAVEAQVVAGRLATWHRELVANLADGDLAVADLSRWDPGSWPGEARGWSLGEAPRGAVGHWVQVAGGRITGYQVVDASTWNGSPRDAKGRRGACEEALVGTPVADPVRPLEILRTVHSFDPCAPCAVHAFDPRAAGTRAVPSHRGERR